jgi:hypothetical protein
MPDQLTDERAAELFAGFRSDALSAVLPPGPDAVRRAHRRHRRATTVTAGLAALAVVGGAGVAATAIADRPHGDPAGPAALPSDELQQLADDAAAQLRSKPSTAPTLLAHHSALAGNDLATAWTPAGDFELRASCHGSGVTRVSIRLAPPAPRDPAADAGRLLGRAQVPCGKTQTVKQLFSADAEGTLIVAAEPDRAARGRAGWAVAVNAAAVDPRPHQPPKMDGLSRALESALPAGPGRTLSSGSGWLPNGTPRFYDATDVRAGHFSFSAACIGTGTLTAVIKSSGVAEPVRELARSTVACGGPPKAVTVDFVVTRPGYVSAWLGAAGATMGPMPFASALRQS